MTGFFKLVTLASLGALVSAQAGPNTLARYNPANRTQSLNATFCILPIDKADVQALAGHPPLDIPPDVLPVFPAGKHPLVVSSGYLNDIRMNALNLVPLQIASLTEGNVFLPYVDVTGDGKTPIRFNVNYYIGGTNGNDLAALVPAVAAIVSPFEGTNFLPAHFAPDTAAAQTLPGGLYSAEVKPYLVPNTISGPGVYAEAFDILFQITTSSPYTAHTFHSLMNHPQLLNTGRCQRDIYWFNQTFTNPQMAVANVTLYHDILGSPPAAIEGDYDNVYCYQANAVEVASYISETCAAAAANVDPASRV